MCKYDVNEWNHFFYTISFLKTYILHQLYNDSRFGQIYLLWHKFKVITKYSSQKWAEIENNRNRCIFALRICSHCWNWKQFKIIKHLLNLLNSLNQGNYIFMNKYLWLNKMATPWVTITNRRLRIINQLKNQLKMWTDLVCYSKRPHMYAYMCIFKRIMSTFIKFKIIESNEIWKLKMLFMKYPN